ncbi:MAG: hypothetical protein K6F26_00380 [Lachnospiraceae bacterium]|nr:hypothetical protein [Lachnospiraceae bacterium]
MKRLRKKVVGWVLFAVILTGMLTVTACSVMAARSADNETETVTEDPVQKKIAGIGADLIPDAEVTTLTESSSPLLWAILLFIAVADFACLIRIGYKSMKNNYKNDAKRS